MDTVELKQSFHNLIDSIDNENLLKNFYELFKKRISTKDEKLWGRLTRKEQDELILALEESENPENLISQEEMKKKHKKWL